MQKIMAFQVNDNLQSNIETVRQSRCLFSRCANVELAQAVQHGMSSVPHMENLSTRMSKDQLPIVYHPKYNISFFGIENLHPFDSKKYGHVLNRLLKEGLLHSKDQLISAERASKDLLSQVHSMEYLDTLDKSPSTVARITELLPLKFLPSRLIRSQVLEPMQYMAGGTVQAAVAALQRGWAINLGGGMHHASFDDGSGWCCYDDISLALKVLLVASKSKLCRALIIDLDAHQGNGYARSKLLNRQICEGSCQRGPRTRSKDKEVGSVGLESFIIDVYNASIFPLDTFAKQAIDIDVPLQPQTSDEVYLAAVSNAVRRGFEMFPDPHICIYNAGTDILENDPLGLLKVTENAVIQRDAVVFESCREAQIPIVMLLSGGYTKQSTQCIAKSIINLTENFNLL